jgi:hypothetical protein
MARSLIDLLESAFDIKGGQIRCTSVPGHKLALGSHAADSLQTDLNGTEIVMGLIGKDTADSEYALFELGASWGLRKPTFPFESRPPPSSTFPKSCARGAASRSKTSHSACN